MQPYIYTICSHLPCRRARTTSPSSKSIPIPPPPTSTNLDHQPWSLVVPFTFSSACGVQICTAVPIPGWSSNITMSHGSKVLRYPCYLWWSGHFYSSRIAVPIPGDAPLRLSANFIIIWIISGILTWLVHDFSFETESYLCMPWGKLSGSHPQLGVVWYL